MELLGKLCMYGGFYGIIVVLILSYFGKTGGKQEILGKEAAGELKGIAILMVLVGHITYLFGYLVIPVTPALGAPAVDLFLFLSAFGLMSSYQKKGLSGFWNRRLAMILIPYVIVTLIKIPMNLLIREVTWKAVFMNLLPIAVNPADSLDTSMWYVQYMLIWYLVFYLVFSIPRLSAKAKTALLGGVGIAAATVCGVLYYQEILFTYSATLTESYSHHLSFPLGALFFLGYGRLKKISWKGFLSAALSTFVIFQFLAFPGVDGYVKYYASNLAYVLFFVAVIAVLKQFGRSSHMLKWLGRYSYYIYLNEMIVMGLVYNLSPFPTGINAVLILASSVLLGMAAYYPCEWILKKLRVH